jgi:hypothetical protein
MPPKASHGHLLFRKGSSQSCSNSRASAQHDLCLNVPDHHLGAVACGRHALSKFTSAGAARQPVPTRGTDKTVYA